MLIFNMFFPTFRRKYVWRSKDHDIPVKLIKVAGTMNGVSYAEVEYEGRATYVPLKELYAVR